MKTIIPLLLLLAACTPAKQSPSENIAREIFNAFNAHDWTKMESLYSPNVELVDPSFGTKTGKEGMTEFYKSVPDIHDEVKTVTASGNTVVVEFVSTGTIDGQKFSLPICTVFKIENGLVVSDHTYYDQTNN
ncbi:MAG TPA: nuclear transport factor 2 family protein [Cyclobacteriaceae bacterium]|nr:nuclear transport factor 2 family protein [Cyclobacteriaceae bacterium]